MSSSATSSSAIGTETTDAYKALERKRNIGYALFIIGFLGMVGGAALGGACPDLKEAAIGVIIGGFVVFCGGAITAGHAGEELESQPPKTSSQKSKTPPQEESSPSAALNRDPSVDITAGNPPTVDD